MTQEEYKLGDSVLFKKNGLYYEGIIKAIDGDKIEIDDKTIKTRLNL